MTNNNYIETWRCKVTREELKRYHFVRDVLMDHNVFDGENNNIISFPIEFSKTIRNACERLGPYNSQSDEKLMEIYLNFP